MAGRERLGERDWERETGRERLGERGGMNCQEGLGKTTTEESRDSWKIVRVRVVREW